ncbi:MAG: hypothetical protein GYA02_10760 [Clostridiaceae bacterium]|jgi:uncharacterized protein|nr:hypothetical protein [Clostridiaceae bacterium]
MCSNQLDKEDNIVGKINKDGKLELDERKHRLWVYNDCFSHEKCDECKLLPLCFGCKCPLNIGRNGWVPCNSDLLEFTIENSLINFYG